MLRPLSMYKLFTKKYTENNSVRLVPSYEYIKRTYQTQLFSISNYYASRNFYIKSNHILARVINLGYVNRDVDIKKFTEIVSARSNYISNHFNFTSPTNYGQIFKGLFYGEGCDEIIISDDSYFNPYEEIKNWRQIKAVEVLDHPVSNLGFLLPNGQKNNTEVGLVFIKINIPLLLLQYRGFELEQTSSINTPEEINTSVPLFIGKYVLPNMLDKHIDICIFNRLMNLHYGAPMGDALKKHPFPIISYEDKIDSVLKQVLKNIQNYNMPYYSFLKNMPSVVNEDLQDTLLMPDLVRTRQLWWALFLARLKATKFLLDVGGSKGLSSNSTFVSKMKLDIKHLLNDNVLVSRLDRDIYEDVIEMLLEAKNVN